MEKRKLRADLILIAAITAVALTALGLFWLLGEPGAWAVVTVGGVEVGRYPLNEDREIVITPKEGSYNLLVIEAGEAYIREASCPGGQDDRCTLHRPISRTGETIFCAPHMVAVRVEGQSKEEVDVIS